MYWITLLFCFLVQSNAGSLGYNDDSLYDCNQNQNYTQSEKNAILKLYPIDAYMFVTIGRSFSFIICLSLISIFIMYPQIRRTPGDLLLGLCVCDMLQSFHYMMSGAFYLIFHSSPVNTSMFCTINGTMAIMVTIGNILYNVAFVCSPLIIISNTLQGSSILQTKIHVLIIVTTLVIVSLSVAAGSFELNLSGLCTVSPDTKFKNILQAVILLVFLIFYIITAITILKSFTKKTVMNKNQSHSVNRRKYLYIYKRFVIATLMIWSTQLLLEILVNLNCYYIREPKLNICLTLSNLISVMVPIIQCYIRAQDPILISKIKKIWHEYFSQKKMSDVVELTTRVDQRADSQPDILQVIQLSIRKTQVYTIIAGILMIHKQWKQSEDDMIRSNSDFMYREKPDQSNRQQKFDWKQCDAREEIIIDEQIVQQTFPGEHEYNVFHTKVTAYCPEIFRYLLDQDEKMVNFESSLDLFKNNRKVTNFGGPDGGKSGEFFFFSWDSKIIIKTMQWSEVVALRERIQAYGNYLYNHSNSLISKIYGMYTFRRISDAETDSNIHVLVMRNISHGYKHLPSKYVLRTFDMKGSEFDREVLVKRPEAEISRVTLKDTDFFKTEKKVHINSDMSHQMIDALSQDAQFFKEARLIDYSLLLFKIDWGSYLYEHGIEIQKIRNQITNPLYMIESTREVGIYYHLAIIDYLQEWNVNKGAEQVTKKLIKFNIKLDTSAQNPDVYAERFQKKLIERILSTDQSYNADLSHLSSYSM